MILSNLQPSNIKKNSAKEILPFKVSRLRREKFRGDKRLLVYLRFIRKFAKKIGSRKTAERRSILINYTTLKNV